MNERITAILADLPHCPGVYQMHNASGDVIYVGKAKDLAKRVRSYFQNKKQDVKTQKLVSHIADISYTEVSTESEALILEANFIREKKPKFNVLLRDDQRYLYIKVTKEDFPQILKVRHISKDKARYFGPFTYASPVATSLQFIQKLFSLRSCTHRIEATDGHPINHKATRSIPCLEYHIQKCSGPCTGAISQEEYGARIAKVIAFLEGFQEVIINEAQEQMLAAAGAQQFEKAAGLRDNIAALQSLQEKQHINTAGDHDYDAIGYFQAFGKVGINVFQVRGGRMINQETVLFDDRSEQSTPSEILERFLVDFYPKIISLPREILLPSPIDNTEWLSEFIGSALVCPQKGDKRRVVDLSIQNARSWMEQNKVKWATEHSKTTGAANELAQMLGIQKELRRIECYDISHFQGTHTYASMVVFRDGKPEKKHYRSFQIKSLASGEINDFASLAEVLHRRLSKIVLPGIEENIIVRKALKKHLEELSLDSQDEDTVFVALDKDVLIGWARCRIIDDAIWLTDVHFSENYTAWELYLKLTRQLLVKIGKEKVYASDSIDTNLLSALQFIETKDRPGVWMREGKKGEDASFTDVPDLIIIDGGKGQLSSVVAIMENLELLEHIPVISLAKREEEVFFPGESEPLILDRHSNALYLIQRLRDEAHRFAITAHRRSRDKAMTRSFLDDIEGIGPVLKKRLLQVFGDTDGIRRASLAQLRGVVNESLAQKIQDASK